jgi:uncharacterized membrane protein
MQRMDCHMGDFLRTLEQRPAVSPHAYGKHPRGSLPIRAYFLATAGLVLFVYTGVGLLVFAVSNPYGYPQAWKYVFSIVSLTLVIIGYNIITVVCPLLGFKLESSFLDRHGGKIFVTAMLVLTLLGVFLIYIGAANPWNAGETVAAVLIILGCLMEVMVCRMCISGTR